MGSKLSPFELKDQLIEIANDSQNHMMLNAGRGNPNFLAAHPRRAFIRLGEFAMEESERSYGYLYGGFGGTTVKEGIGGRFNEFLVRNKDLPGTRFLRASFSYMTDQLGLELDEVVFEFCEAYLGWQLGKDTIEQLEDPAVKVLYLVNPSNPPSVKMSTLVLNDLADLVKTKRPDLMIITDDVYGTFADDFLSLAAMVPANTLVVYSFSKYFGATGWRLGVIGLAQNNIFDEKLKGLDDQDKAVLDERYSSLTRDIPGLKFIDRLVADSRAVALNHTAGLSLPQQLQMTLFSLSALIDTHDEYKNATKKLIRKRYNRLMQSIGYLPVIDDNAVEYYTLLDLQLLGEEFYNKAFGEWILNNNEDIDFLFTIAKECGVVLLPGNGFDDSHPSARVSLANLAEWQYEAIGKLTRKVLDELYQKFNNQIDHASKS